MPDSRSKAFQKIGSELPLSTLSEGLLVDFPNALADRQRGPHVPAIYVHQAVPADGDLEANLGPNDIKQCQFALRRKQPSRHAQAGLEQHAALQRTEALALARRWVYAGQLGRLVLACAGDAAVDERVGRKLGAGLFRGAFEGEVGEGGRGSLGGEQAVEVLGGGAVDGGYDEVAGEGCILR